MRFYQSIIPVSYTHLDVYKRQVREFLADTGMTAEQIDRVAYLVGHHHSPAQINGIDYQILIEADYIVNASESGYGQQAIRTFMEHTMKTAAGIRLTKTVFGV